MRGARAQIVIMRTKPCRVQRHAVCGQKARSRRSKNRTCGVKGPKAKAEGVGGGIRLRLVQISP